MLKQLDIKRIEGPLLLIGLLFSFATAHAQVPAGWSCDEAFFQDGICDCGCDAIDRDCQPGTFEICERDGCAAGTVPWEHQPYTCMRSACGDGWADEANGEVCDDGEALRGGGCSADCTSVNDGWTCGQGPEGCERLEPEQDADVADTADMSMPEDRQQDGSANESSDAGMTNDSSRETGGETATPPFDTHDSDSSESGCSITETPPPLAILASMLILIGGLRRTRSY